MKILDVGCGFEPIPGAIGIDLNNGDIHHNLDTFPYPIRDNSIDKIYSRHCLEHLDEFQQVMEEFWRIIKPDGIIEIIVPFYASYVAHHPTHKRYFNYYSFEQFTDKSDVTWKMDSKARFSLESITFHFYSTTGTRFKLIKKVMFIIPELLSNNFPLFYQRMIANILPAYEMRFILKPIKHKGRQ